MYDEINKALEVLKRGQLLLYPTDTVWGIGCDATRADAVQKIYELKKRESSKAMICLVDSERMLERYIQEIPDAAYDILHLATRPTTIIYDGPVGVAKNLIAEDDTLAIRVTQAAFSKKLIQTFRKPIVSTSANISGAPTPTHFKQISSDVITGVDYVVQQEEISQHPKPSSIIKLNRSGVVQIIRE